MAGAPSPSQRGRGIDTKQMTGDEPQRGGYPTAMLGAGSPLPPRDTGWHPLPLLLWEMTSLLSCRKKKTKTYVLGYEDVFLFFKLT